MTASRISKPCKASSQKGEMRTRVSAFWMMPSSSEPSSTPITVPLPPSMFTPPTTEAATVCSSKPRAVLVWAAS